MSRQVQEKPPVAEVAPIVLEALQDADDYAEKDLFDELDQGEFYGANGDECEITFTGATSRPGSSAEIYGYVAAEVSKEGGKPVTVGVLASNGVGRAIVEFSKGKKGKKYWSYDSDEPRPKFVRKTLARLGIDSL